MKAKVESRMQVAAVSTWTAADYGDAVRRDPDVVVTATSPPHRIVNLSVEFSEPPAQFYLISQPQGGTHLPVPCAELFVPE